LLIHNFLERKTPMKKLLLIPLLLISFPAFAGYDTDNKPFSETPDIFQSDLETTDYLKVWRTGDTSAAWLPLDANPLVAGFYQSVTIAELSATEVLLPAVSGRTYQVLDFGLESSGTMSGATAVTIECTGGTDISAIAVAAFVTEVPIGPETSAPAATSPANMFTQGACPAGEGVQVKAPAAATATHLRATLQYIWQ